MIFVTLGSQKFQFNRLLEAIDKLIEQNVIRDEVFAQIGYSDYLPAHYRYVQFVDREQFLHTLDEADIVITHGGTGAIISALKKRKKVIAVPRLAEFEEHVDDHQIQLVEEFSESHLILGCRDCMKLADIIEQIQGEVLSEYVSNTDRIIKSIDSYLEGIE